MKTKYLKMVHGIQDAADAQRGWSVYMVRCSDESLYTGIAKDVDARLAKHNAGKGAAYTRARRPVRLLYREDGLTRREALVREASIKALPKPRKESIVSDAQH
jgi:predicted GIY-YIG superfamily endonuclease